MKGFSRDNAQTETAGDKLFNYPTLERLFAARDGAGTISEMRRRMMQTMEELERVVRRGSKEDAESAVRVIGAYRTAFELLEELERGSPQ